jgi:hypothetical protein
MNLMWSDSNLIADFDNPTAYVFIPFMWLQRLGVNILWLIPIHPIGIDIGAKHTSWDPTQ